MAQHPDRGLSLLGETSSPMGNQRDLRGRPVLDRSGERIGDVTGLVVDSDRGWIRFLVVTVDPTDGVDGFGVPVPVDSIALLAPDRVRLDQTRATVLNAPPFSQWTTPDFWEFVVAHFVRSSSEG